ncbi:unnamed protein product [Adineta ricciae]|uniref:TIR domain-containing protein n=2 Tax=Adineta ricciae TaxID=249248 RepID=A0A815BAY5_ADIRI|nr:unnamed protein product [Adineta ricciae]
MSGDLNPVSCQILADEFINSLKALSTNPASENRDGAVEQLHLQLKRAIPHGLQDNKTFAFAILNNLCRVVPIFDAILSNNDEQNNEFIQTKQFLETLANAFYEVCLVEVLVLLKDPSQYEVIFRNYIVLLKETYFLSDGRYDGLINCILPIVTYSSIWTSVAENDVPKGMLAYLLTFTKKYWHCQERERVIQTIFGVLKVFSKKPTLVSLIIESRWPHSCIQWIADINTNEEIRPSSNICQYIHLVLQKLARHPAGVETLNQLNCRQILCDSDSQLRKCYNEIQYNCFYFLRCMIYALLMEADEIKQMSMCADNRMCQTLHELVSHTIEASRRETLSYRCFHISEMLIVLCKLFVNDDILTKCMNENEELFQCLSQLIVHFAMIVGDVNRNRQPIEDESLLALTNLLWSISFHQCYHEKFQSNSTLMHTISNLATSSVLYVGSRSKSIPRDLCTLKKAAEGIIWNLKSSARPISNVPSQTASQRPLAMISYSHSDSEFCRELVERLSAHVPVWVDYKQAQDTIAHSDDLWEEIARAMELATIIVLIVSKEYYDSKSCRQELSYASDTLKKRIVPVYAPNQQYRASGWLGIRIAGQKYIHFGRKLFADAIKELASMFDTEQKPLVVASTPLVPLTASETTQEKKTEVESSKLFGLKDWTAKDIRQWFDDNHIHENLTKIYADQFQTGTSLIVYARHVKLFYRNEYIRAYTKHHKIFHGKKLDTMHFITFVDALYRLRQEYDPNGVVEDTHEKYSETPLVRKLKVPDSGSTWF